MNSHAFRLACTKRQENHCRKAARQGFRYSISFHVDRLPSLERVEGCCCFDITEFIWLQSTCLIEKVIRKDVHKCKFPHEAHDRGCFQIGLATNDKLSRSLLRNNVPDLNTLSLPFHISQIAFHPFFIFLSYSLHFHSG
jgi:hypothetical protein